MRIKDILDAYRYIESKDQMATKINNAIIEHSGGRPEEVPAPMIAPKVGEIEIKSRSVYFATIDMHGLAAFTEGKDIVSVSRDCGTNNVTVFYWG